MFVAILAARTGWHTEELARALAVRGARAAVFPYETLVASLGSRTRMQAQDTDLLSADAVLTRIIPNGSLEQIVFRVDALHALEDAGVPVMNPPRAIERTVDKFYTSALLARAGLPTPETIVCERSDQAMDAFHALRDVIVKPLVGSMGLGMVRVMTRKSRGACFARWKPFTGCIIFSARSSTKVATSASSSSATVSWAPSNARRRVGAPIWLVADTHARSHCPPSGTPWRCVPHAPSARRTPASISCPLETDQSMYSR